MLRVLVFFYFILVSSSAFSEEIPVIVISAGKTPQSKSTVGSDVTVIDSKTLRNSNEFFIGDILDTPKIKARVLILDFDFSKLRQLGNF